MEAPADRPVMYTRSRSRTGVIGAASRAGLRPSRTSWVIPAMIAGSPEP
jgi:hypothetical protein